MTVIGNAINDGNSQRVSLCFFFIIILNKHTQWLFEDTGLGWTLKSVGTGKYIGRMGVGDSLLAMACDEPVTWDVWPDEQFCYKYRYVTQFLRKAHQPNVYIFRIFVHGTKFNLDLSNHGNATPGTPIALWARWHGLNQLWSIEPGEEYLL
jgi:hypothetical protein